MGHINCLIYIFIFVLWALIYIVSPSLFFFSFSPMIIGHLIFSHQAMLYIEFCETCPYRRQKSCTKKKHTEWNWNYVRNIQNVLANLNYGGPRWKKVMESRGPWDIETMTVTVSCMWSPVPVCHKFIFLLFIIIIIIQ